MKTIGFVLLLTLVFSSLAKAETDAASSKKLTNFGMKLHVGADVNSGVDHSLTTTPANVADITELPHLLRDTNEVIFGDAGLPVIVTIAGLGSLAIKRAL